MVNILRTIAAIVGLFASHSLAAEKPNIIFIMADDLGWKDVAYAGAEFFETPNIDALSKSGMTFEAAYSGGPNCAPTRACLMTGTYTPRHAIYQPIDGTDVSPLLSGKEIPERAIFWHYPLYLSGKGLEVEMTEGSSYSWRGFPSTSLRRGNFKMIEFLETDTVALYDLSNDLGETHDISAELPEIVKNLRAELDAWQEVTKAPIPTKLNPKFIGLKMLKASQ